jgi:hypothetical protein
MDLEYFSHHNFNHRSLKYEKYIIIVFYYFVDIGTYTSDGPPPYLDVDMKEVDELSWR